MDRQFAYPGQIPLETDLLNTNKYAMVGLAKLAAAMLGTATIVNGLACVPTGPASLQVVVNPGEMYSLVPTDGSAYSSLSADAHNILKQGISLDPVTLSCPAPATAGQSINYLIQAAYQDQDTGLVTLPYYNASNPSQAWSGPGNSGAQQATTRKGAVLISAKAGTAAATGSQTTPAPDAGYTGLWVVTVANGQSTITSANISQATNAPILPTDLLHAMQQSGTIVGVDTGAANAYAVSYNPAITALTDGMVLWFKVKTANSGASTLNVNGLGASPLVGAAHSALQGGELVVGGRAQVVWRADISSWVLESCTGAALQVGPAAQSQHAVQLGQVGHGQCRLSVLSGTSLKLSPYNGNNLIINGVPQQIPAAGVTIANTGLAASTLYYVYAYMNAGAMALELSATGHSAGSNGVEQKTGDATRTLVGMIYTNSSTPGQFVDTITNRQVANWFNRRNIPAVSTLTIDTNFTGGSFGKVSTSLDVTFPYWGDNDGGVASLSGSVGNNTSGGQSQLAVFVDGAQFGNTSSASVSGTILQNAGVTSLSLLNNGAPLAEGFHVASAYGASSASSTSTLRASSVVVAQTRA